MTPESARQLVREDLARKKRGYVRKFSTVALEGTILAMHAHARALVLQMNRDAAREAQKHPAVEPFRWKDSTAS